MVNDNDDGKCILVLNSGSSSLKYEIYQMPQQKSLGRGSVERIGEARGILSQNSPKGDITIEDVFHDHAAAMQQVGKALVHSEKGILASINDIDAIGHRVVHGGEKFAADRKSVV